MRRTGNIWYIKYITWIFSVNYYILFIFKNVILIVGVMWYILCMATCSRTQRFYALLIFILSYCTVFIILVIIKNINVKVHKHYIIFHIIVCVMSVLMGLSFKSWTWIFKKPKLILLIFWFTFLLRDVADPLRWGGKAPLTVRTLIETHL